MDGNDRYDACIDGSSRPIHYTAGGIVVRLVAAFRNGTFQYLNIIIIYVDNPVRQINFDTIYA
jgi:hypothetical protein